MLTQFEKIFQIAYFFQIGLLQRLYPKELQCMVLHLLYIVIINLRSLKN